MQRALLMSNRHNWQTPPELVARVRRVAPIALDPCASRRNNVGAKHFICLPSNGLKQPWPFAGGLVFVNPPYGRAIGLWTERCCEEAEKGGREIVLLVPSRTDTVWWQETYCAADAVCLYKGRVVFVGAKHGAPFPTSFFYFGGRSHRFEDAFGDAGIILGGGRIRAKRRTA